METSQGKIIENIMRAYCTKDLKSRKRFQIKKISQYIFHHDLTRYRVDFIDVENNKKYPNWLDTFTFFYSPGCKDLEYRVVCPNRNYTKRAEIGVSRQPLSEGKTESEVEEEILDEFKKFIGFNQGRKG